MVRIVTPSSSNRLALLAALDMFRVVVDFPTEHVGHIGQLTFPIKDTRIIVIGMTVRHENDDALVFDLLGIDVAVRKRTRNSGSRRSQ